jgi:CheY-like chemotaxis protein/predicted phosphodiesterase
MYAFRRRKWTQATQFMSRKQDSNFESNVSKRSITPQRVLLVENEPDWQRVIQNLLLQPDFDLQVASSFREAERRIREPFDLIILNLCLVHDNDYLGVEVLADLADYPVPCIVLTGSSGPMRGLFERYNIYDAFVKGSAFNMAEFLSVIKQATSQPQVQSHKPPFTQALKTTQGEGLLARDADVFTWLHLSDLHLECTARREYQIRQVVAALKDDLERLSEEHPGLEPNAVFFTGDLTNRAKPDEFSTALEDCLGPVLEQCGLSSCDLFLVPGNHDVNRAKTTELDAGIVRGLIGTPQIHAMLTDSNWAGYRQQLLQRMQNYHAGIGSVLGSSFDTESLVWGRALRTKSGNAVGVIGLNSVWTSGSIQGSDGEVDDQGKLVVGKPLIHMALEQMRQECSKPTMCIALMHHPLSWLRDWDQQDAREVLGETCQFCLHGHIHETRVDFIGAPSPTTMLISAGTLSKRIEARDVYTCLHAYNITRLDLASRSGTIYFRRFDTVRQRYGIDDTSFKGVSNGQYSFHYGENGFQAEGKLK